MDDYRRYVREVYYGDGKRKTRNFLIVIAIIIAMVLLFTLLGAGEKKTVTSACEGFSYFKYEAQKLQKNRFAIQLKNGPEDVEIFTLKVDGMGNIRDILIVQPDEEVSVVTEDINVDKSLGELHEFRVELEYTIIGENSTRKDSAICRANVT